MPVGMLEEATAQKVEAQLAPGDKLVLYSDGLTETENSDGVFFDSERLRVFLRDHARQGAAELHASLLAALDLFGEGGVVRDDVTLLVLEYAQPG
jgi:sigma-B regulation protein RsbU (phosphoserine phosphatase)